MGNMKDRYVRFDWAIKRLLRQKANFGVLEGFLTVFIGEPITILEILENHGEPRIIEDKYNRLDIKVLNTRGEIIIIEIQNIHEMHYLKDTAITPDSKTPGLAEASGCLKYNSLSQGERYAYRTYIDDIMIDDQAIEAQRIEGRAEGHKPAIAENYMKGREEERLRNARGMKSEDIAPEVITRDYRTYGRGDSIPLSRLIH